MSDRRRQRREAERRAGKLARDRDKLARAERGGSPENPLHVVSASLVEVQARSVPCPLCGGALRVDEHAASTLAGQRLRVVRTRCVACGVPRTLYFSIVPALH